MGGVTPICPTHAPTSRGRVVGVLRAGRYGACDSATPLAPTIPPNLGRPPALVALTTLSPQGGTSEESYGVTRQSARHGV
jgi:hypothetical protein